MLFKDLLFSVHYLLIISECWRRQKAKDKQAPIELENIPAIRQTQIGWVCRQKHSQEREQSLLLQEKGQLVSEAHGRIKLETETWSKVPSGSCPHTSRLCLSEAGMCTSRLLCASMQWLGHKCATANLAPSARGCPSAALRCSFTGFKHQLARSLQSCVPVRQPADIKNISAPLKSHLSVLRKCLVGWVSTQVDNSELFENCGHVHIIKGILAQHRCYRCSCNLHNKLTSDTKLQKVSSILRFYVSSSQKSIKIKVWQLYRILWQQHKKLWLTERFFFFVVDQIWGAIPCL